MLAADVRAVVAWVCGLHPCLLGGKEMVLSLPEALLQGLIIQL